MNIPVFMLHEYRTLWKDGAGRWRMMQGGGRCRMEVEDGAGRWKMVQGGGGWCREVYQFLN